MFDIPFLPSLFKIIKTSALDDLCDRANYMYVPFLLTFFTIFISAKQYIGAPIQCWFGKEFAGAWMEYAEDYCFIQDTYYVPLIEGLEYTKEQKEENEIFYYQWVPFVLAIQAICFYIPFYVYSKHVNRAQTLPIECIVSEVRGHWGGGLESRKEAAEKPVEMICSYLLHRGKDSRFGVIPAYILLKLTFIFNLAAQVHLVNVFLGHDSLWAFNSLYGFVQGMEVHRRGYFPRVTFCDFQVRDLGNLRNYSTQCVLMINMFNEKIYMVLWLTFTFMIIYTISNLCSSLYHYSSRRSLTNYVIEKMNQIGAEYDASAVATFAQSILRNEGVLTLRLIETHTDPLTGARLTANLYNTLLEKGAFASATMLDLHPNSLKGNNNGIGEGNKVAPEMP